MYSTFFLGTLYLEQVRGDSALETGAAFLPWTLTVAVLSQAITARLVGRFGPLPVLTAGMASAVAGLLLFATVGTETASSRRSSSPASRSGSARHGVQPLLMIAMADVPAADAGLGSGITNVSRQLGGALGLAVLSTVAANHTEGRLAAGEAPTDALIGGYQVTSSPGPRPSPPGSSSPSRCCARAGRGPELQLAEAQARTTPVHVVEEQAA